MGQNEGGESPSHTEEPDERQGTANLNERGTTMPYTFSTSTWKYEYVHGKRPRGFDLWVFLVTTNNFGVIQQDRITHIGTLTAAKKQIIERLRAGGYHRATIEVLP